MDKYDELFKAVLERDKDSSSGSVEKVKHITPDVSDDETERNVLSDALKKVKKLFPKKNKLQLKKLPMKEGVVDKPKKRVSMKECVLAIQRKRIEDDEGTWVQCCNHKCSKFRYLKEIKEPFQAPAMWFCKMNKDLEHNTCEAPEEDNTSMDMVLNKYTAGSIVWVKVPGYPWWPAMVDDDPDLLLYFFTNDFSIAPTHYHVVFLDDKVSRAWISQTCIKPFSSVLKFPTAIAGKHYETQLRPVMKKANRALNMTIEERLLKYSFVTRYTGSWPLCYELDDTTVAKKQKKQKEPKMPKVTQVELTDMENDATIISTPNLEMSSLHNSYLEEAELLLSQFSELEASFEARPSNAKEFKDPPSETSQKLKHVKKFKQQASQEEKQSPDKEMLVTEAREERRSEAETIPTPEEGVSNKTEDKPVGDKKENKTNKEKRDKPGKNISKSTANESVHAGKKGDDKTKSLNKSTSKESQATTCKQETAVFKKKTKKSNEKSEPKGKKPVFKIKRKSGDMQEDEVDKLDSKSNEGPKKKIIKPSFTIKKKTKTSKSANENSETLPTSPQFVASQDLFPPTQSPPVELNNSGVISAKNQLEFNLDSLFQDVIQPQEE